MASAASCRDLLEHRPAQPVVPRPAPPRPPRGRPVREPNTLLEQLIGEAGMSHDGFAARVNKAGALCGLTLLYDHASVRRWIRHGQIPRDRVPELICEVLSARLGRAVTPAGAGFGPAHPDPVSEFTVTVQRLMNGGGVSLRELARRVHYDQGTLSKIISGKRPCPGRLARLIDDELGAGGTVWVAADAALAQRERERERERAVAGRRRTLTQQVAALADEIRQLRAEIADRGCQ